MTLNHLSASILHMTVTSLVTIVVVPYTGKIITNWCLWCAFERGEHFLQNGILDFVFKLSQSCYKVRIYTQTKTDFSERALRT